LKKIILLLLTLSLALFGANQIKLGTSLSELNSYKYETPNARPMKIPQKTKLIILAFEKDTGKLVNAYLEKQNPYYLTKRHAIYIADISNMPSIITHLFALPKLRKYKHLIYLHYEEIFQTVVPHNEDEITIMRVDNKKITEISFVKTVQELKSAIEK
jgi:hypothetical protein